MASELPNNNPQDGNTNSDLALANQWAHCIVTSAIAITGIVGNSVVILAIILSRQLRSTLNWFVLNLACADIFTSVSIPCYVASLLPLFEGRIGLWYYGILVGISVSLTTHAFIAFTSWYLITKNHSRSKKTFCTRNIFIMIAFTWVFTIVAAGGMYAAKKAKLNFNPFVVTGTYIVGHLVVIIVSYLKLWRFVAEKEKKTKQQCNIRKRSEIGISTTSDKTNVSQSASDTFSPYKDRPSISTETTLEMPGIPHQPSIQSSTGTTLEEPRIPQQSSKIESERALRRKGPGEGQIKAECLFQSKVKTMTVTKSLLVVLAAFIFCFIPHPLDEWLDHYFSSVKPWGITLICCISCINPMIYAGRIRAFKEVMVCIICCRYRSLPMPVEWFRRLRDSD